MEREKINLSDKIMDVMFKMSEGNPGALRVLMELSKETTGIMKILSLDDMNIRGTQIWIGYKDFCQEDMEKFKKCILARDEKMIAAINKEGLRGNHREKAVSGGASRPGGRELLESARKRRR